MCTNLFHSRHLPTARHQRVSYYTLFSDSDNCTLCIFGRSISRIPPPRPGINNQRLSQDPTQGPKHSSIASLYRRFRGNYFRIALKTSDGFSHFSTSQQPFRLYVDIRLGLQKLKLASTKNNESTSIIYSSWPVKMVITVSILAQRPGLCCFYALADLLTVTPIYQTNKSLTVKAGRPPLSTHPVALLSLQGWREAKEALLLLTL